jgi:hypothetical protein
MNKPYQDFYFFLKLPHSHLDLDPNIFFSAIHVKIIRPNFKYHVLTFSSATVFFAVRRKLDHKIFNCSAPLGADTDVALNSSETFCQASFRCFNEDPSEALFSIIDRYLGK